MTPVALTIAGSDPSGGAGIQADLKTFHEFGVYGQASITLVTVQNTRGVEQVHVLPPELVIAQIRAAIEDIRPNAAKTGALGNQEVADAVAALTKTFDFPLVTDPVMSATSGANLGGSLIPAFLVTPNLEEASMLAGFPVRDLESMRRAAEAIHKLGATNVLVKGGHLSGDAVDLLYSECQFHEYRTPRINTRHTHGTGCTYSAAITAELAKGTGLIEAVRRAKEYITAAIRSAPGLGCGAGPVNHFARNNRPTED